MIIKPIFNSINWKNVRWLSKLDAAGGAAAAVSLNPTAGQQVTVHGVVYSYSAAPTGGKVTITDGTTTIEFDVTAAGPNEVPIFFPCVIDGTLTVTLAAPGGAVVGKLNVLVTLETMF